MTGKRQTGIDMIRTMLRETTNPNGLDQHGSRLIYRQLLNKTTFSVQGVSLFTFSHFKALLSKKFISDYLLRNKREKITCRKEIN